MIADCVEDSELRTGRRSEGLFFSASSLMQKAIGGIGVMASGIILAYIAFPAKAKPGMVDQAVLDNLVLTAVPTSGVLYAIGTACLLMYGIDRDKHEANLRELETASPRLDAQPSQPLP
jgi:Na+/melibiose symporter-like transporter